LCTRTRLTAEDDVTSTDKLPFDVNLGDGRPLAILLDSLSELLVSETVEALHLLWGDSLKTKRAIKAGAEVSQRKGAILTISNTAYLYVEDLTDCSRETTLRCVGRSLHEYDEGVLVDGLVCSK